MSVPTVAAGALLDVAAPLPAVGIDDLLGDGALLVVAPHPDDETLGCGAALAAALATGRAVTVALLTDGGGSHPRSRRWPPPVLTALRRAEFERALATLAAAAGTTAPAVLALELADTAVAAGAEQAVAALTAHARSDTGTIWCTWGRDPHADHEAAARIADAVAAALARDRTVTRFDYAVWGRFGAAGAGTDPARVRPFRPGPYAAAKRAAMAHYRSQLTGMIDDDPDGFVMPPALVAHFADAPELFLAPPR